MRIGRQQTSGSAGAVSFVLFAGGPGPAAEVVLPPPPRFVIAANGGALRAEQLGLRVDLLVGDLDSAPEGARAQAAQVEEHPAEKEAIDLELALDAAVRLDAARILVVGSAGGRLDHLVGSVLLLAADAYAEIEIDAHLGEALVHVVRSERTLRGKVGDLLSLFAVHGPAHGVVTSGLAYPLAGETLTPGSSRGTSNVFAADEARVRIDSGVLLAIRPSGSERAGTAL